MFISIVFLIAIIAIVCIIAAVYAKAKKVKEKHIEAARKRGDTQEVKRLEEMSVDEAADEFEEELDK
ncbi:MAG TPA: hypothetical protein P5267_01515 [Patescibacteria group bacterium]|nr:hypothetical protein [Patescibacteria group bacterium]